MLGSPKRHQYPCSRSKRNVSSTTNYSLPSTTMSKIFSESVDWSNLPSVSSTSRRSSKPQPIGPRTLKLEKHHPNISHSARTHPEGAISGSSTLFAKGKGLRTWWSALFKWKSKVMKRLFFVASSLNRLLNYQGKFHVLTLSEKIVSSNYQAKRSPRK